MAEESALLELLFATSTMGVGFFDRELRFCRLNEALARMNGRAVEEHLGRGLREVLTGPAAGTIEALLREVLTTGRPTGEVELSGERPGDPSPRWYTVRFHPVRAPGGEVLGAATVVTETTDRHRAEAEREALRRAEAVQRLLLEASDVLSASLDPHDTLSALARLTVPLLADWCVVDVLDAAGRLERVAVAHPESCEQAAEELRRPHPERGLWPGLAAGVAATGMPELAAGLEPAPGAAEGAGSTALGEADFRSCLSVPLVARGRTLGVLTLIQGESGRRFGEEDIPLAMEMARRGALAIDNARLYAAERDARAEAEGANRAKADFLAVMSHELRTPLNAIAGYTELLSLGIKGALTEGQRDYLARIRRSQRHLLALINDVLNFARIEAGHVELAAEEFPLAVLLADLEPMLAPQIQARRLRYELAPCGERLAVRADPEKTRQVLLNLLSNAVKFTPPGGRIRVSCRGEGARAAVQVSDTGAGIPPAKLEAIFDPFVQVGRGLTSAHEGAGLGLAISRDLARAMGGDLTAESRPGEGATFTLTLPVGEGAGD